ncbi:hypothetical protein H6P81_009316 [Aristolochia fimbriata]|uniref:Cystatin domain-containing protein n=1 Tax=Aristolochia fimbriata TaxID=158543 RepID=A0AAV7EN88_ARIFI|nr:hypothetical protein H6P81_009316 [Aristolochia fimbriata]
MRTHQSTLLLLLVLLPLLAAVAAAGGGRRSLAGEWQPIDVSSTHVRELGAFAVGEHNTEAKTLLSFRGVVSGETYLPDPTRYRLVVEADDNGVVGKYAAEVWEQFPRRLVSFKPVA